MRAAQQVERQPIAASEKRRAPGLGRFSLALAAAVLAATALAGGSAAEPPATGLSMFSLATDGVNAALSHGARFVSDLRLLYGMAHIQAASTPAPEASSKLRGDAQAEILNCTGKALEQTAATSQPTKRTIKVRNGSAFSYQTASLELRIRPSRKDESGL